MNKILILIIAVATITSCSKNDDDDSTMNEIVGEWKLTKAEFYGKNSSGNIELFSIDYSNENITYNFNLNNELIVSGGENVGYNNGEYDYVFEEDYLSGFPSEGETKMLLVKINTAKWTYDFTNGTMKLGRSYLDGSDLYFERK